MRTPPIPSRFAPWRAWSWAKTSPSTPPISATRSTSIRRTSPIWAKARSGSPRPRAATTTICGTRRRNTTSTPSRSSPRRRTRSAIPPAAIRKSGRSWACSSRRSSAPRTRRRSRRSFAWFRATPGRSAGRSAATIVRPTPIRRARARPCRSCRPMVFTTSRTRANTRTRPSSARPSTTSRIASRSLAASAPSGRRRTSPPRRRACSSGRFRSRPSRHANTTTSTSRASCLTMCPTSSWSMRPMPKASAPAASTARVLAFPSRIVPTRRATTNSARNT